MVPRPFRCLPLVAALAVLGLAAAPASAAPANPAPNLLPSPQQWTGGTGDLGLGVRSRIVVDRADTGRLLGDAGTFATDLRTITALPLPVVVGSQPGEGDLFLTLDPGLGHDSGYRLSVTFFRQGQHFGKRPEVRTNRTSVPRVGQGSPRRRA